MYRVRHGTSGWARSIGADKPQAPSNLWSAALHFNHKPSVMMGCSQRGSIYARTKARLTRKENSTPLPTPGAAPPTPSPQALLSRSGGGICTSARHPHRSSCRRRTCAGHPPMRVPPGRHLGHLFPLSLRLPHGRPICDTTGEAAQALWRTPSPLALEATALAALAGVAAVGAAVTPAAYPFVLPLLACICPLGRTTLGPPPLSTAPAAATVAVCPFGVTGTVTPVRCPPPPLHPMLRSAARVPAVPASRYPSQSAAGPAGPAPRQPQPSSAGNHPHCSTWILFF